VILVDTAVWIDHFRDGDPHLAELLDHGVILAHPWVTGEIALGHLRARAEILRLLHDLPQATVATGTELLQFIEHHELYGLGIAYVDAQLLAATMLSDDATLWTNDRRLRAAAQSLGTDYKPRTGG
jgi:predicted nucleic acid-binding protein